MFPLIETIRLENGTLFNLDYHQRRMDTALRELFGSEPNDVSNFLNNSGLPRHGLYKCRVIYTDSKMEMELEPYAALSVQTLKMVHGDSIGYGYKFEDRRVFAALLGKRGNCDDILVIKKGKITDSSYANIVFKKGDQWFTPSTFLLPGTQRQYLLDNKRVQEAHIEVSDLGKYDFFKLVNAMLRFDGPEYPVRNIQS